MSVNDDAVNSPVDFERLLPLAVTEALREENPEAFFTWVGRNLRNFMDPEVFPPDVPEDLVRGMSYQIGLMIWNALPLPGNGFQPRPLPLPGRNDPCPCGSSRKYKQCCASAPRPPALSSQLLWPLVLERAPQERVRHALEQQRLPLEGVLAAAMHYKDQGKAKKAARLLESLLDPLPKKPHPLHDTVLNLLCDFYDELGYWRKKLDLLEGLGNSPKATSLRASAWQRLATYRIDHLDAAGAWEAFHHALRDNPDDPGLAILELQLLGAEQRWQNVRERARFWTHKLRRRDYDPEMIAPLLEILDKAAKDPQNALDELYEEMVEEKGEAAAPLRQWIAAQLQRPVSRYEFSGAEESPIDMARHLRVMGLKKAEITKAMATLEKQKAELLAAPLDEEGAADQRNSLNELELLTPKGLEPLEAGWHKVAKLTKPFGCNEMPMDDWNGWSPRHEANWSDFLAKHPQAFDSLDIIDDLVTACFYHPDYPEHVLYHKAVLPLLERARAIVEASLAELRQPTLPWVFPANRSALRSLVRLLMVKRANQAGAEECEQLLSWLLRLNPADNHGLRQLAVNEWLQQGRNEEARQLAERYPEDMFAETRYGLALALYRLDRPSAAQQAAAAAIDDLPLVGTYLVKQRVRRPKLDAYGFRFGGEDQAWLYREGMLSEWQTTPGALQWLARIMKQKGVRV